MYFELERNLPGHPDWEGSCYERLTEYAEWDAPAFWKLHLELLKIAQDVDKSEGVNRDLAHMLLLLQQKVLTLICAHFNKRDAFEITNMDHETLYEFRERFDAAIIGAVSGEVLPESSFDLINPLFNC